MAEATDPVTLFYSYAHEDEPLRDELQGHLKILERRGLLAPWHDRKIMPGQDWAGEIDANLRSAELVLLLVSTDFIQSDYIWGVELVAAMERHAQRTATIVPIMIRPVDLDTDDAPFMKLQGLPTDLKPVTSWANRDEAWTNVAKGLRATVKEIRERRPPPPPAAQFAPSIPVWKRFDMDRTFLGGSKDAEADGLDFLPTQAEPEPEPPQFMRQASSTRRQQDDPVVDKLVAQVAHQMVEAQQARNEPPLNQDNIEALRAGARELIDAPDQKRVLWVDDRPEGNIWEAAALAKLQIEIVTARSTEEALVCIAHDHEGFDLVISDWERAGEPPDAGLRLLERLRQSGARMPLVYYHGAKGGRRERRAVQARAAGAAGEAVLPYELMALVAGALAAPA